MERVMLDEDFLELANQVEPAQIYELIEVLNKAQQEMRWTNHPRIFLEVAIVKLCQLENQNPSSSNVQVEPLLRRIEQLEEKLVQFQQNPGMAAGEPAAAAKKAPRPNRKGFQAPAGKINEVLKSATKTNLHTIKGRWGDLLEMLAANQMRSQAALLNEAEPVAASDEAVVIKFKYEIHCQMTMENTRFTETVSGAMNDYTGKRMQVIGVPEDQWLKIRENFISQRGDGESEGQAAAAEDPLIAEAKKLFGDELIQIQD